MRDDAQTLGSTLKNVSIFGVESLETNTVQGIELAGALGSLSFVPVLEKQVFSPVEEY